MATALTKARSSADTELLWQAIEALEGYELQNLLTNELLSETDRVRRFTGSSRLELVRELVERGADVNAVRADGFTPLLLAGFFGHLDVVQLLVEHGADLNACTRFETSAEMWAQARGFIDIVEYLQDCRDKSLAVSESRLTNNEWFKESLVAEPVIEGSLPVETFAASCEEYLEPTISPASEDINEHNEQSVSAEPVIEASPIAETSAPLPDEYLEPTIPPAVLETNEHDQPSPDLLIEEPSTIEMSTAPCEEYLQPPILQALLIDNGHDDQNITAEPVVEELASTAHDDQNITAEPIVEESSVFDTSDSQTNEDDDERTLVRPRIEESSIVEMSGPASEEYLQSPILRASLIDNGHDDQNIMAEPIVEELSPVETFAASSDEYSGPTIPPASLEINEYDDENPSAEPVIEESAIVETVAALEEQLQPAVPSISLEADEDDDERTLVRPRIQERVSPKTLKDPPEIWDLVHENRNSFNPRAAFLSHLRSLKARTALLILLLVAIAAVIGFATRGLPVGQRTSVVATSTSAPKEAQPQPAEKTPIISATNSSVEQPTAVASTQATGDIQQTESSTPKRRSRQSPSTSSSARVIPNNVPVENVPSRSETKTLPPVRTVTVTATLDAEAAVKKPANSNSELIQNSSTAQPRKPRVIQWP